MKTLLITTSAAVMFIVAAANVNKITPVAEKSNLTAPLNRSAVVALINNMEYGNDQSVVRSRYNAELDKLAASLKSSDATVSLKGHADSIGAYKYNWMLSDRRALAVKNYLVHQGVKEAKIVTTPFGSTVPIASNKTPEGRQRNRRVEITVQ